MTQNEAREAIYKAFIDVWDASYQPISDYTFDNEQYDPPNTAWVRLSVRHKTARQETLGATGNRRFLRSGMVFVQIFVPHDTGTYESDQLTMQARAVFEGVSMPGTLWFQDVYVRELGVEGQWYKTLVEAHFQYEDTH